MKICVLAPSDLDQDVGANIVVRSLLNHWRKSHSVTLMTGSRGTFRMEGVEQINVRGGTYKTWLLSSASKIREAFSHDIILDEAYTFPLLEAARLKEHVATFSHSHGVARYSWSGHALQLSEFRNHVERLLSIRSATSTIVASQTHRAAILANFGTALSPRVHVIPHGVEPDQFPQSEPKGKNILFVGSVGSGDLFVRKGVPILLEAFSMLLRESPGIELFSVGDTDQRFETACREFGVTGAVRQLGRLEHNEMARVYQSCRVLAVPSLFDTYGQVVNEAMASGMPVVVSDGAGASEVVRRADCGLIFRAGNTAELTDCLGSILADDGLAAHLGKNGRRYARLALNWESISRLYIELFKSAIR